LTVIQPQRTARLSAPLRQARTWWIDDVLFAAAVFDERPAVARGTAGPQHEEERVGPLDVELADLRSAEQRADVPVDVEANPTL
jgi:hypothetical protein